MTDNFDWSDGFWAEYLIKSLENDGADLRETRLNLKEQGYYYVYEDFIEHITRQAVLIHVAEMVISIANKTNELMTKK